jgi:hypothetical protein
MKIVHIFPYFKSIIHLFGRGKMLKSISVLLQFTEMFNQFDERKNRVLKILLCQMILIST